MIETATFACSICSEPSLDICARCTKDACPNHRCVRCKACSDCCECEVPLTEPEPRIAEHAVTAETPEDLPAAQDLPEEEPFLLPPQASEEPDLNLPEEFLDPDVFAPEDDAPPPHRRPFEPES
ncbi:MAG: hypothetical protein M3Z32_11455 [Acidobacteriota bacterium]|nr:hypothetical protein [Acidobacteriota bacterium]